MSLYGKRYTILYRFILFYMFKWREYKCRITDENNITVEFENVECIECDMDEEIYKEKIKDDAHTCEPKLFMVDNTFEKPCEYIDENY